MELPKTKVSKDLGLATDLPNTSGRSASRAMPKAKLTYCLKLTVARHNVFVTYMAMCHFRPVKSVN